LISSKSVISDLPEIYMHEHKGPSASAYISGKSLAKLFSYHCMIVFIVECTIFDCGIILSKWWQYSAYIYFPHSKIIGVAI